MLKQFIGLYYCANVFEVCFAENLDEMNFFHSVLNKRCLKLILLFNDLLGFHG